MKNTARYVSTQRPGDCDCEEGVKATAATLSIATDVNHSPPLLPISVLKIELEGTGGVIDVSREGEGTPLSVTTDVNQIQGGH